MQEGIKINKEKTVKIILIVSTLMLLFEIIKQGLFTHVESAYFNGMLFLSNFCSTPMYIALLHWLLKMGN